MAYSNTGLRCLVPTLGGGPALWIYSSTDPHTTVDTTGYFSDGADFGLAANDAMIVIDTSTPTITLHHVLTTVSISVSTYST